MVSLCCLHHLQASAYAVFDLIILQTFWHSSAHVLGEALELEYGVDLTIGPALEEGFYYDCYMGDKVLTDADKANIEKRIETAVKENQRFERVVVSREEALSMFQENKFKVIVC